jgi:hypothetical protein
MARQGSWRRSGMGEAVVGEMNGVRQWEHVGVGIWVACTGLMGPSEVVLWGRWGQAGRSLVRQRRGGC